MYARKPILTDVAGAGVAKESTMGSADHNGVVDHPRFVAKQHHQRVRWPKVMMLVIILLAWRMHMASESILGEDEQFNSIYDMISAALRNRPSKPIVIAHVVSLIKCTNRASVTGFLDSAAVLRHSLHKQSVRTGASKYDYRMYAIVDKSCAQDGAVLARLGYTLLIRPPPVLLEDIKPGWYRDHVETENCCGSAEFIKLYAYTLLDHPISVHWDLDAAVFQPMDDLFDSMLLPADSPQGRLARSRLNLQHPERPLPQIIDAFFTRDIASSQPWKSKQGVQGGFLVAKTNMAHFEAYLKFIMEANYVKGRGDDSGWGGLGYGGFQGARTYQGVVAYFYDQLVPDTAVELDVCIWNQGVADVIWRGPERMQHAGQCREHPQPGDTYETNTPELGKCRDCRIITPADEVKSAHFTACKKPWQCALSSHLPYEPRRTSNQVRELTNVTTSCGLLFQKWTALRRDFEDELYKHGGPKPSNRGGGREPNYFNGYCRRSGKYIAMVPPPNNFDMSKMYGPDDY